MRACVRARREKESDDSYYLYHLAAGASIPPPALPSPTHSLSLFLLPLCKTMDYVWYAHESMHSLRVCVVRTTFPAYVWEELGWGWGWAVWGVHIHPCMHVCVHAGTLPPTSPHPPLHHSFLPSLSIYHASIGLSASGMRCGERGRGEGYTGRNRNKFSPPNPPRLPTTTLP